MGFQRGNTVGRRFQRGNSCGRRFEKGNTVGAATRFRPGHCGGRRFQAGNTVGAETRFRAGNTLGWKFAPGDPRSIRPGETRNPGGLTKGHREVVALRRAPSPEGVQRLAELMESDDDRTSLAACRAILALAWG